MNREQKLRLLFFVCCVGSFLMGWILADLTAPLISP